MAEKSLTVEEAIKIAIQKEIDAYNIYKDTSEKVVSNSSKKMLLDLAQQELGHRKLLENVLDEGKFQKLGSDTPKQTPGISNFLKQTELEKYATPQEVMIFAMKEEEKAFNFYNDMKSHFSGTELENVFDKLADEEKSHKAKLEKEYDDHFYKEN